MSNSSIDKSMLAGDAYFANVIRIMGKAQYGLISRVSIDTDDHPFHVPVRYARVTNLFFRLRAKKLVIQMTYNEIFYPDDRRQPYWEINVYAVFRPVAELVTMLHRRLGDRCFDENVLDRIPLYGKDLDMPEKRSGSHSNNGEVNVRYELSEEQSTDSAAVARNILRALFEAEQYIGFGKFREMQVTSFAPSYVFPESSGTFWSRFDMPALNIVITRPWGDDALESIAAR